MKDSDVEVLPSDSCRGLFWISPCPAGKQGECFNSTLYVCNYYCHLILKYWLYLFVSNQLKKTSEELNEALSAKEEIAQRCHELDMQVRVFCVPLLGMHHLKYHQACRMLPWHAVYNAAVIEENRFLVKHGRLSR